MKKKVLFLLMMLLSISFVGFAQKSSRGSNANVTQSGTCVYASFFTIENKLFFNYGQTFDSWKGQEIVTSEGKSLGYGNYMMYLNKLVRAGWKVADKQIPMPTKYSDLQHSITTLYKEIRTDAEITQGFNELGIFLK